MQRALVLAVMAIPAAAHAQDTRGYLAPSIGATFSGDTTSTGTTVGVAGGWRTGWLGIEGEVTSTPNFFEQTDFLGNRWVTTIMGNALVHYGSSKNMSVFVIGGFGALRVDLAEAGGLNTVKTSKPAFDIGGGAMRLWSNNVGVRGDIRYVRAVGNTDDDANGFGLEVSKLSFVRATAALVVGF